MLKSSILFLVLFLINNSLYADSLDPILMKQVKENSKPDSVQRLENIEGWENLTVEKGFVLSNELYYKRLCSKVWKKQIPEFHQKNPHIKDVNKFWPGDKITIQICKEIEKKEEKKKKRKVKKIVEVEVEEDVEYCEPPISVVEEKKEEPIKEESSKNEAKDEFDDLIVFLGGGFLTEIYEEQTFSSGVGLFGFRTFLEKNIMYKLKVYINKDVSFLNNEVYLFKNNFFISFGLNNRVGFTKRSIIKLTDDFSSFGTANVGYLKDSDRYRFEFKVGSTLNSDPIVNLSVRGLKRFGSIFYGAYFDYMSSDYKINISTKQRTDVITSGLLVEF